MISENFGQYNFYFVITPNDLQTLAQLYHKKAWALYIGTGGDVTVGGSDTDPSITFKNVPSGTILPIHVTQVYASGTTASNIVGLMSITRT